MKQIWITSDLHFNHSNIIKHADRPFTNVDLMNDKIITNWNNTVKKGDDVYIVGDFAFYSPASFKSVLNGNLIFIKGNHDKPNLTRMTHCFIQYSGKHLQLVHNKSDAIDEGDYIIHGHNHNKPCVTIPVITTEVMVNENTGWKDNMVCYNVNTELHNYAPVNIKTIIKQLENHKRTKG